MVKKIIDTATKTRLDAAKTALKELFKKLQKQQEIQLEIADKITSAGISKKKQKIKENRRNFIYQKKDNKLLML